MAKPKRAAGTKRGELGRHKTAVNFTYRASPEAERVQVAGDFNQWEPTTMTKENGLFHARIPLSPGPHEYRFIVDGRWCNDPVALAEIRNPFGGTNSVVVA